MAQKRGLGKGLEALFIDNDTMAAETAPELVKLNEIEPNRGQPRKQFNEEALQQLADSIRENGLIQPLIVRPMPKGGYQVVAGERRWRACRMAGLTEVPVVVKDIDDQKTMELALIENLQREDLNGIEEAAGYQELMDTYGMTQENVSKCVGKSRSAVANMLRLLSLPKMVQALVRDGELSTGHARALLGLLEEEKIAEAAKLAIKQGWTVRDTEKYVQKQGQNQEKKTNSGKKRDSFYDEMEVALKADLGRRIKISANGNKGTIEIPFYNKEELADIARRLAGNE